MKKKSFFHKGMVLLCLVMVLILAALPQVFAQDEEPAYSELTLANFGLTDDTIQGGDITGSTGKGGTLDHISVEGTYNFTQKADANCIYFGGVWKGVKIEPFADGRLAVTYWDENFVSVHGDYITPEDAGMRLTGTDLKLQMSFAFENEKQGIADLKVTILLNGIYEKVIRFTDVTMDNLQQTIFMWSSSAENPLSYSIMSYDEMTLYDYGFGEQTVVNGGNGITKTLAADKTLNKTAITGKYQISKAQSNNAVYFGGTWVGVKLEPLNDGSLLITHVAEGDVISYGGVITPEEAQADLTDKEVTIRTSFLLMNEASETADLRLGVTVNDSYTEYYKFKNIPTASLKQILFVWAAEGTPLTLKTDIPEQEITKPNMTPFNMQEAGISNGRYKGTPPHLVAEGTYSDTLINKALTQKIMFSENAVNTIKYAGLSNPWQGISFSTQIDGTITISASEGEFDAYEVLTPEIAGTKLVGEPIVLSIELFEDGNDVMLGVSINGKLYNGNYFRLLGAKGKLGNYIGLYIENRDGYIQVGDEVTEPGLSPITFSDFGIPERNYTCFAPHLVAQGTYKESLVGTVFTDKITFSEHSGNCLKYAGKENAWQGISFEVNQDGAIVMSASSGEFVLYEILTPEIAGTKLVGEEIELTIELIESGKNVSMGVSINGKLYKDEYFMLLGAAGNLGSYLGVYVQEEDATIQVGRAEEPPVLNPEFREMGFYSYFCVYSGTYGWNEQNGMDVSGFSGIKDMNRVVFSDTLNFTDTPGASIRLAGKEMWFGLQIESVGGGKLRIMDAAGSFRGIIFDSQTAGVQLTDNDIKMTLSFEHVDSDNDGQEDDMRLGVWFNDKPYNNTWIYLRDYANALGEFMGIYSSEKNSSITIKTKEAGIDYAEYGFTEKWKITLGIK